MTSLIFDKKIIRSARFNGESSLPPIAMNRNNRFRSKLDEDDELHLNYGYMGSAFPYKSQDMYDRALIPTEYDRVVLENDNLRAEFLPHFGGRLWSLFDKQQNKELLFVNDVIRPCNLATRNAWLSGGVEWNVGFVGHHPHTCSLLNTEQTSLEDGTPVLRFYYFERVRCVVVQMDFFLPDGAKFLFCRMRITNPNHETTPMYWWSNIAVEESEDVRVVVPADQAYTAISAKTKNSVFAIADVCKIDVPMYQERDVTYPRYNPYSIDYFWKTKKDKRKYICQLDKNGYGLVQASTDRLKGRKLFVWGNSRGGSRWQNYLTSDDKSGSYNEIQCGLAASQYECLPMPPSTVWEWVEVYGAMQADPMKVHGDWAGAQTEVEAQLDRMISAADLEKVLEDTRAMAKTPATKRLLSMDNGWGALELYRRSKTDDTLLCPHLNFGDMGAEQEDWRLLLDEGTMGTHRPEDVPASYMRQEEWLALLEEALENKDKDNWYTHYVYGVAMVSLGNHSKAFYHLQRSLELQESPWAHYAVAIYYRLNGRVELGREHILKAYQLFPADISLAKDVLGYLHVLEDSQQVVDLFETATDEVRENKRCLMYYAFALARLGRLEEAENILCGNGYLFPADVREGEESVTNLWLYIQEKKYPDQPVGLPPMELEFRTFIALEEWKKKHSC